jgi:nucleoside-diphosphate-sugar epimerase
MRILILGGDGYLGRPTAMRFSVRGHAFVGSMKLVRSTLATIDRHRDRVISRAIAPKTQWRPGETEASVAEFAAAAAMHDERRSWPL